MKGSAISRFHLDLAQASAQNPPDPMHRPPGNARLAADFPPPARRFGPRADLPSPKPTLSRNRKSMKSKSLALIAIAATLATSAIAEPASISFLETAYHHRWSQGEQHEFTPPGQEDLSSWKDMLTVNRYPDAKTGEALATVANNVLGLYQQHGAHVLRTDSVPRTEEKESEHLIAAAIPQKEFIELVFARFAMAENQGYSVVYSHKIYGEQAGQEASAWLQANGKNSEDALMKLSLADAIAATKAISQTPQ